MSDATDVETAPQATTQRSSRRWVLIVGVVAVLAVTGVAAAAVIANEDDEPAYAAPQIGWMHQGCQEWADSHRGADGPNDAWCTSMAGWMNGRMGDTEMMGQDQMMGSMMWQDAASTRTTCEQWMAAQPDAARTGSDTTEWCGQMTDWMDQHMGGWDDWMHNGPMMGNP